MTEDQLLVDFPEPQHAHLQAVLAFAAEREPLDRAGGLNRLLDENLSRRLLTCRGAAASASPGITISPITSSFCSSRKASDFGGGSDAGQMTDITKHSFASAIGN